MAGHSRTSAVAALRAMHPKIKATTARSYVDAVFERWREDGIASADRESKRDLHRARLERLLRMANERRRYLRDEQGEPIVDEHGEHRWIPFPDTTTAAKITAQLARLDGLNDESLDVNLGGGDLVSLVASMGER